MKKIILSFSALATVGFAIAQQAIGILDINKIHCNVSATGDLFNRFEDETLPGFEVPAGSDLLTIYAANLWVGGITPDQQLKLAAEMYQANGQDWFPGPLTTDGTAEIDQETQDAYNQVWVANLVDVETHIAYFDALANGQSEELFPDGYSIPQWFFDWPAHGNTEAGQDYYLAPFSDYPNSNPGVYDPENGDTPLFCGEKCVYFIFNDKGNVHTESQGQQIGLEIHGMLYGFNSTESDMLNNTVFLKYKIINRGMQTLTNTYVGMWTDFDLGNHVDDYVATNVNRSSIYAYNGDELDEAVSLSTGYQDDLPMQSLTILKGISLDNDNIDNALPDDFYSGTSNSYGAFGFGFEDNIIDNESYGLSGSIYYNNSNGSNGEASTANHYYNYLRGLWGDGSNLLYGGNGFNSSLTEDYEAEYFFPNNSDPLQLGTGVADAPLWNEETAQNPPGDRRMLATLGPFTLTSGAIHYLDAAYIFARESDNNLSVSETLEQRMIEAKLFFNEFLVECNGQEISLTTEEESAGETAVNIFPNPASNLIQINVKNASEKTQLELFDMTGKMLLTINLATGLNNVDVSALSNGVYSAVVSSKNNKHVSKLVIQ